MNKKASWMQELQFPSLTPKQLSSRALLVEEMDRMCDKAVQNGASTAVYQFVNGRRYANQLLDWSPEEDAPAQNTSAAQKAAYERKIEKQENLMETVVMHIRSFALAAIERLPTNMRSAVYMKFPKETICSEQYGEFDMVAFGFMYKSLSDLMSEVTLEQRAEKLREDVSAIMKKGCIEKGQLPTYFKQWNDVFMYGKHYELNYDMKTLIFNAATGLKVGKLSIIYRKYKEYCASRDSWKGTQLQNVPTEEVDPTASDDEEKANDNDPVQRAVNAAKLAAREEIQKAAQEYIRQSAAAAGINPENGVPLTLDKLFNPLKFKSPNDICTEWMKAPMDTDDDKENRQISLNTMEEKVKESLESQAAAFATIFQTRGIELTDAEKKSLSKPSKKKGKQVPQKEEKKKEKKKIKCYVCGEIGHYSRSKDGWNCPNKEALKKYLLEDISKNC